MTKKEIQNIISKDWEARRQKVKKKQIKNSKRTKEWKTKEKLGLNNKDRKKHYLPGTGCTEQLEILSLLVSVTYAKE